MAATTSGNRTAAMTEELLVELELLSTMFFPNELAVDTTAAGSLATFRGKPSGCDEHDYRTIAILRLAAPANYPNKPVAVDVPIVRGLSEQQSQELSRQLTAAATDSAAAGEGCLYQLISATKEFIDEHCDDASCVVCYLNLSDASATVTLPTCLHSFHGDSCLFPWWAVRLAAFAGSPAELARREAAQALVSAAGKLAAQAGAVAAACEARLKAAESALYYARNALADAERQRDALRATHKAGASAGAARSAAGGKKSASGGSKKGSAESASGVGGGAGPGTASGLDAVSLESAEAAVRTAEAAAQALHAEVKSLKCEAGTARYKAHVAADKAAEAGAAPPLAAEAIDGATASGTGAAARAGAGGGASVGVSAAPSAASSADAQADASATVHVLVCPTCRTPLLPAAGADTLGGRGTTGASAACAAATQSTDVLGREPAAIAAEARGVRERFERWQAASALPAPAPSKRPGAGGAAPVTKGSAAAGGAASAACAESWDHSDPALVSYVREMQSRHAAVYERQAKTGGLVADAAPLPPPAS
jgi:hypothetical protein